MLRPLIVLFVFAAIICASHQSCFDDESEVISINRHNPMQEYYKWKRIEITPTIGQSDHSHRPPCKSSSSEQPNPLSNFAVSAVHYKGRIFISLPRKQPGVISTLNYVYANHTIGSSPPFRPYPNVQTNELKRSHSHDAVKIISVYHLRLDECNRLWMVDTGMLEYPNNDIQVQRPAVLVFDLDRDRLVRRFEIPESVVRIGKGMDGIAVDVDKSKCDSAYAYIPSHLERRIHIYSLSQNRMWSISHSFFGPDPLYGDLEIERMKLQIPTDGVFSIALGPREHNGYRNAYFHALSSVTEFYVSTKTLQDEAECRKFYHGDAFKILGRRFKNGHSSTHNYDPKTGVMFFAQPILYGVACWNIHKPFTVENQAIIATDMDRMRYASDLNVDHDGVVWLVSNPLTGFLFGHMKPEEVNYRLWRFVASDIIKGTVCERPGGDHHQANSFTPHGDFVFGS